MPWESGRLRSNLLASVQRVALGLAFGVPLGTVLALVSGLSRWGEAVIDGPIQIKRAIPALALMPLLVLWPGIGEGMKVTSPGGPRARPRQDRRRAAAGCRSGHHRDPLRAAAGARRRESP